MNAHFITLPIAPASTDFVAMARTEADQLHAIIAAASPLELWDEMLAYCRCHGCRDMSFVDMGEPGSQPVLIKSSLPVVPSLETLRRDMAGGNGGPVLVDGINVLLPAFGPRGLEAALIVRLGRRSAALPLWTDSLFAVLQLAYSRFRQMSPIQREDEVALSEREREIMEWVVRGKSNSVIGSILGISASTVDTYMRRIFRKLDVADRTSAAMRLVACGAIA